MFGRERRRRRPVVEPSWRRAAERRRRRLAQLEEIEVELAREWWRSLLLAPVGLLIGLVLVWIGIDMAVEAEWEWTRWVKRGRAGGPLWLGLSVQLSCGGVFLAAGLGGPLGVRRRRRTNRALADAIRRELAEPWLQEDPPRSSRAGSPPALGDIDER